MSSQFKGSLPLAFVLAMAAEVSVGTAAGPDGNAPALSVGSLSSLLEQAVGDAQTAGPSQEVAPNVISLDRLAQWLNFRNCVTGGWRNC